MIGALELNKQTRQTASIPASWVPAITIRYQNFDEARAALLAITPPNAQLLAMARKIKPDFSWYPTEDTRP